MSFVFDLVNFAVGSVAGGATTVIVPKTFTAIKNAFTTKVAAVETTVSADVAKVQSAVKADVAKVEAVVKSEVSKL